MTANTAKPGDAHAGDAHERRTKLGGDAGQETQMVLRLVEGLARAHAAGLDLTRRLCAAQALADASEVLSHELVEMAAEAPWDEEAITRAVAASAACEAHAERERAVEREWAAHRVHVRGMLEEADTVLSSFAFS